MKSQMMEQISALYISQSKIESLSVKRGALLREIFLFEKKFSLIFEGFNFMSFECNEHF